MIANNEPDNSTLHPRMTWAEMKTRYPREWIVIAEPELNEAQQVTEGRVAWHGADREQAWAESERLERDGLAIYFTGPLAKKVVYVL